MEIELFTRLAGLAALAVVAVQEILKLKVVPVSIANRYPVLVNFALSVVAAVVVVWQSSLEPVVWTDWLILSATISVVAAVVYNNTLSNSEEIKELEG